MKFIWTWQGVSSKLYRAALLNYHPPDIQHNTKSIIENPHNYDSSWFQFDKGLLFRIIWGVLNDQTLSWNWANQTSCCLASLSINWGAHSTSFMNISISIPWSNLYWMLHQPCYKDSMLINKFPWENWMQNPSEIHSAVKKSPWPEYLSVA